MAKLPDMIYSDGISAAQQIGFGGLNHTAAASEGDIYDMQNMSSSNYPLLSPREPRVLYKTLTNGSSIYADDSLYYVDGTGFYKDGVYKGSVAAGAKTLCKHNKLVCIFPDKKYYDTATDEFGSLEASVTGNMTFRDGLLFGEEAVANCIYNAQTDFTRYFSAGDGVEISGCVTEPDNNKTAVIQEISADGHSLYFYENVFTLPAGAAYTENGVTIARRLPDMDYVFENENRLWGCKGSNVYASKLGDPKNWNVFSGLSTDSYSVSVGSAGDFTGACSYLGYPMFFKENYVYKMYGSEPENYQLMSSATLGASVGTTFAIAGETLFYLSRAGVCAYGGGIPVVISSSLGESLTGIAAGTDGTKYYLCAIGSDRGRALYVFDTTYNTWHIEDDGGIIGFAYYGRALCALTKNGIYALSSSFEYGGIKESAVTSFTEFADFYDKYADKKRLHRMRLRAEVEPGAALTVSVQYDSGEWQQVYTMQAGTKQSCDIPIIPRRCDHYRIKIAGVGRYKIYALTREYSRGSA